jgi:hypothetical protein
MSWYYMNEAGSQGPFEVDELRGLIDAGQFTSQHQVWTEGMEQWSPAGQTLELAPLFPTAAGGVVQRAIGEDNGPFRKIGFASRIAGAAWRGAVVASPNAVYFLKASKESMRALGHGLVIALIDELTQVHEDIRTCRVADLAGRIRGHLDPNRTFVRSDVVVLPKSAVHFVRTGWFDNTITFRSGKERFTALGNMFAIGGHKKFLKSGGWTLNQEVVPTAAPIHGESLNR